MFVLQKLKTQKTHNNHTAFIDERQKHSHITHIWYCYNKFMLQSWVTHRWFFYFLAIACVFFWCVSFLHFSLHHFVSWNLYIVPRGSVWFDAKTSDWMFYSKQIEKPESCERLVVLCVLQWTICIDKRVCYLVVDCVPFQRTFFVASEFFGRVRACDFECVVCVI